jgi:hypothetical protein
LPVGVQVSIPLEVSNETNLFRDWSSPSPSTSSLAEKGLVVEEQDAHLANEMLIVHYVIWM